MADNHRIEGDGNTAVGLVGTQEPRRLSVDVLVGGVCRASAGLSSPEQGQALLVALAAALDGLGWLPAGVRDSLAGRPSEAETTGANTAPSASLQARIAREAKDLGVAPADVELLGHAPVLWAGWEAHSHVALVRFGRLRWFLVDDVYRGGQSVPDMLRERLGAYAEAIDATRRLLAVAAQYDGEIEDAGAGGTL